MRTYLSAFIGSSWLRKANGKGSLRLRLWSSLVCDVEDLLFSLHATVSHFIARLVERLWLVEIVAVGGSNLISVLILLSAPALAVVELAVTLVAADVRVGALGDNQASCVVEGVADRTIPPVWLVMFFGAQVAGPGGSSVVVLWLVVGSSVEHGAGTVAAAAHLHRLVVLGDALGVPSAQK